VNSHRVVRREGIVPTKTSSKSKKPAAKEGAASKKTVGKARATDGEAKEAELFAAAPAPSPGSAATRRPIARPIGGVEADSGSTVVPARRLTPEAKAAVNAMVAQGVPLGEALKRAASWETFVAPVKEEPAKLVGAREPGTRGSGFRGEEDEGPDRDGDEEESSSDSDD
jgi:hypothetical protein